MVASPARMAPASRFTARLPVLAPHIAHVGVVTWLFWPTLFEGRMHFMRDISTVYYPDYVFLASSLAKGVWPLWHPGADAGAPFFMPYPVVVLLIALLGPSGALAAGPPLHVLLAMIGTTLLSRVRGGGPWGSWAAGALLGLSGYVLSTLLFPVFLALAWTPLILLGWWRLQEQPSGRRAAALAALLALQVSTFGGEMVVQTAFLALLLRPPRIERSRLAALLLTAALSLLLAAPVLLGSRALLRGTPRGGGFGVQEALTFSAPPAVLAEALLPRFLGEVHNFTDYGFWGQPFFPTGYPFILSLYLGLPALVLALLAGRDRLWLAVGLGVLLSLGAYGPAAGPLAFALRMFRVPVKFFFLSTFAIALLAGQGVDRMQSSPRRASPLVFLPAAALLWLALVVWSAPAAPTLLMAWLPETLGWRAQVVFEGIWPSAFLRSGLLATAAALSLVGAARFRPLAPVIAAIDLLMVNTGLNPTAPPTFYELRPETRAVVRAAEREGRFRWFSCGLAATPPIRFDSAIVFRNSDFWLYALERQALLPRSHVLDGLEGALDEDRTGLLPEGAPLPVPLRDPARASAYFGRLRLANVRWVISWRELPAARFSLRATIRHPEIRDPMHVYELRDPLPRAFWVGRAEVISDPARRLARLEDEAFDAREVVLLAAAPPIVRARPTDAARPRSVRFEPMDPHTVRLTVDSPPGFIVILDGFHRDWRASGPEGPEPILEANGRYRAIATRGGRRELLLSYQPPWLWPSLGAAGAGVVLVLLASWPRVRTPLTLDTPERDARQSGAY